MIEASKESALHEERQSLAELRVVFHTIITVHFYESN
jgi:hypothetical protein